MKNQENKHTLVKPEDLSDKNRALADITAKKYKLTIDEIMGFFNECLADPFIQRDPQFQNDEERHDYAMALVSITAHKIKRPIPNACKTGNSATFS